MNCSAFHELSVGQRNNLSTGKESNPLIFQATELLGDLSQAIFVHIATINKVESALFP